MADLIGGAVISEVLRQLIEEVKKFKNFKPLSKDLASTMKRLVPLTETIDSLTNKLNLDDGELKGLKETIERAKIVIDKCRDVSRLKRSKRTREIEQVNKDMQNYCQIDIQLLLYRNQLQSTDAINNNFQNINQKLDQLSAPAPVFRQSMEAINNNLQIIFEKLDRFVVSAPGGCGETTLVTQLCHDQDIKAEKCGRQAGGPTPPPPDPTGGLTDIITRSQFDDMLKHRNEAACPARGFYTYEAFIAAAKYFPSFCNNGDTAARKKELAAFFGQTSHETSGGWPTAPDGPYSWGYCFKEEVNPSSDYCSPSPTWPCAPGKRYYGRGPMQLSWNYNYGKCGAAIGEDLLNNPDLVSSDPVISFKTAIWFWMTPQSPEPSCHAVINGQWQPSDADIAAGRLPGYGVITNIINGGLECGHGPDPRVLDRIGFYERYCGIFGVDPGSNLDCYNQRSFASVNSLLDAAM